MKSRRALQREGIQFGWAILLGAGLAASPIPAAETNAPPAAAPASMTPEQMFEGGTNAYVNWVEIAAGGFFIHGNKAQFQERHQMGGEVFGGVEDFHYFGNIATNTTLTLDGRAIFDNEDYRLKLEVAREKLGYLRFSYDQFRTWYNGDGGFYSPDGSWYALSGDALELDRGEFSFEAGLTLEKVPKITFRYTHRYRDGEKSSTSWGPTHHIGPAGLLTRGLSPSFYDIDERLHIFELDATQHIKATDLGVGVRYETADLNDARKMTFFPGETTERRVTDRQETDYGLFNAHAFTETWIKKKVFLSSGFSFSDLNSDFSGSRIYGSDFDVGYVPDVNNGVGYQDLSGTAHTKEYVMNVNLMATPFKYFTVVPSVRVLNEDRNANSIAAQTDPASGFLASVSDGDLLDVRERLDLRYTGVTNWLFFARGEWTEGEGKVNENGGLGTTLPIQRRSEDDRLFQKYSLGARWYATRRVTVDVGGYYKINQYDYDHLLDSTANASANRYPAYLVMQDFETYDANVRLTLRPWQNVTLLSRYEYQWSTIHTEPDPISGLAEAESSQMRSHIIAQNVSWAPWSRLYLQAGFNYVLSETKTPASGYVPPALSAAPILAAQNNYWTLNFSSGVVLDEKTDLNLGYFFYQADNYQDNSSVGVPYGAGGEEHGITATLVRRLTKNIRLTLRYGYFLYDDETSGGNKNYRSHMLFSGLQYRF